LIVSVIPVVVIAIGLVAWVIQLRADLDVVKRDMAALDAGVLAESDKQGRLHSEVSTDLADITNDINERINRLETALAVAEDQQRTIMADHEGFGDVLSELGQSGILPSGERRVYGSYGTR
jgi:hypothetical protein